MRYVAALTVVVVVLSASIFGYCIEPGQLKNRRSQRIFGSGRVLTPRGGGSYEQLQSCGTQQTVTHSADRIAPDPKSRKTVDVILVLPGDKPDRARWGTATSALFQDGNIGDVTDSWIRDADIEQIRGASHVWNVAIGGGPDVSNKTCEILTTLPSLAHLTLDVGPSVNDDGLKLLAEIPTLTHVSIAACHVTDEGVSHLAKLPQLEVLTITECPIVGTCFEDLAANRCLRSLSVSLTNVDDRISKHFHGFPRLEHLSLRETKVTDRLFWELARLKSLRTVDVTGTNVSREALKEYQTCHPQIAVNMYW